ncbi:MAG: NAD(P)-dependent oxidoreductase [Verrucomicrobia bacterium]|nr:NAD(P)-dependent oxidoreductase [Verrucomicrobiota bacterium]
MILEALNKRAEENRPIRVGIIGAGKFGAALVSQIYQMKGMVVSVVADVQLDHAKAAYLSNGVWESDLLVVEAEVEVEDAIRQNRAAITEDGLLICRSESIDVVVDTTGSPEAGARFGVEALTHRKHLVMVNVEADVCIGPYLRRFADEQGVVYTLVDGDQPGCTMNLVNWTRTLGFEIVAAGRGTVYYVDDFEGTPDTVPERYGFTEEMIERRHINLRMYNSFRDGTKAQTEMVALANAAGLVPDVRGMHEPGVNLADIPKQFSLKSEDGLLSKHGVVELANSVADDGKTMLSDPLGMGVFVVIRTEHPFIAEDLGMYFLHEGGDGKNFLLQRPYHLVAVETPLSIAQAALFNTATGSTLPTPTAELITVAKQDLSAGKALDGSGGYTVNGICEKADVSHRENLLPLAFAKHVNLNIDVRKGNPITWDMVDTITDSYLYDIWKKQADLLWT